MGHGRASRCGTTQPRAAELEERGEERESLSALLAVQLRIWP